MEAEKLSDIIKAQCTLAPTNIALITSKQTMDYKNLMDEISAFGKLLAACYCFDKSNKCLVALHLPNSITYVISLLAVLWSNMAFLPLPVDLPKDRLTFIAKDAEVEHIIMLKEHFNTWSCHGIPNKVVLTHTILGEKLIVVKLLESNMDWHHTAKEGDGSIKNDKHINADNDFSYVIYTSGSTGRPKGVKVRESSIVNLARAQITCWDISYCDVIAQFASIGFDASVSEIFTCLLSGASLAVLDACERLGNDFVLAMNQMKVTLITLPSTALTMYEPSCLPCLRKVVSAGEQCTLHNAIKWTSTTQVRFFNAYGPTEATVCATSYEYIPDTSSEDANKKLPIGKAIDGVKVFILDDFLKPVRPKIIGEIYISGKGVSSGYVGHASKFNRDKFLENPLEEGRDNLYKTGDSGCFDSTGNIIYIGRKDEQIKIRGHRIDLAEIETVLEEHPRVELAVVAVHKCVAVNDQSLAAFIAPRSVCISEIIEHLSRMLPKFMHPVFFRTVDVADLPRALSGKINRKQLAVDESVHDYTETDEDSDLNETQQWIADIWNKILGLGKRHAKITLQRRSSFSKLGGNSLQRVLLQREISDHLHVEASFSELSSADTVEEFAEVIGRKQEASVVPEDADDILDDKLKDMITQDSILDKSMCPNESRPQSAPEPSSISKVADACLSNTQPKNVMISGVTGFLGAFILSALFEMTDSHVFCLVRCSTEVEGTNRVVKNMEKYHLWKPQYSSRITAVSSDLSQKKLGISQDVYKSLSETVQMIFMNAAKMNFNTSYEDHRRANVESTKEFIKFATTGIQKYLYATSSLVVFLFPGESIKNGGERKVFSETDFFDDPLYIEGGYGQSKWASERLVMQALDFLPGGTIFRPARVSGRSTDGAGPRNDVFASMMIGMKRLGAYPDMDFPFDLVPVDFCARAIVEIALKIFSSNQRSSEKVYHLFNQSTMPFKDIFSGMDLSPLPLPEWRQLLKQADESHTELLALLPFFMSKFWDKAPSWPVFLTTNTDHEISDGTKECMKPTKELMKIYKTFYGI